VAVHIVEGMHQLPERNLVTDTDCVATASNAAVSGGGAEHRPAARSTTNAKDRFIVVDP
jgi:hypothetical protein